MRICIVSDAWFPQINGVVRTLDTIRGELADMGHTVEVIGPSAFHTVPCPTYPEIRLATRPGPRLARTIDAFDPDALHIATEGPLGFAARAYARRRGIPFTTAYHTRFPEYVRARFATPLSWSWKVLRWFHGRSAGIMVATHSIADELRRWGLDNIRMWSRGVNTELFHPRPKDALDHLPRPVFMFVGRVAIEKNIAAFLRLDLPGSKVVIGDGPQRPELERRHPEVHFLGAKKGEDLARHFAAADVFVFPSRTDTFGLVMLEALASGVPVAAFPVPGPVDVIGDQGIGVLDEDLGRAARAALDIDPATCRAHAERHSWRACAELFLTNLEPFGPEGRLNAAE